MSQGCNFINSLMSASRRRSTSVTPPTPSSNAATATITNNSRRTSSSQDLTTDDNECYIENPSLNMLRLQIDVDETTDDYVPQIDLDDFRIEDLEDECKDLEAQVEYWEQKVENLERKRFGEDVPRTLVERFLKERKKLRDLDFELYKLDLEEEEEEESRKAIEEPEVGLNQGYLSHPKAMDSQSYAADYLLPSSKLSTGKFGSHIRPGQENTADILDAIPPSGSLQHRQYLSRASTGTDSSEYSHLPTFDLHKHHIPRQHNQLQPHYIQ